MLLIIDMAFNFQLSGFNLLQVLITSLKQTANSFARLLRLDVFALSVSIRKRGTANSIGGCPKLYYNGSDCLDEETGNSPLVIIENKTSIFV